MDTFFKAAIAKLQRPSGRLTQRLSHTKQRVACGGAQRQEPAALRSSAAGGGGL